LLHARSVNILQVIHALALFKVLLDAIEDFSESLVILADDVKALLRVLPVLADMVRSSCVLVVMVGIRTHVFILIKEVFIDYILDVLWNVHLLSEVLNVKTEIYDLLLEASSV
jgi:hypothetical protein